MEGCPRLIMVVIKLKIRVYLQTISNSRRLLSQAAPLKEAKVTIR